MLLAVISPEHEEPRERRVLKALFSAGLARYHVRRPGWDAEKLRRWLLAAPATWRASLVLHGHPELAREFGLAGAHWREAEAPLAPPAGLTASRACHTPETLAASLGTYAAVLYSPVFGSISKPGHGPTAATGLDRVTPLLTGRTPSARRTKVYALGGLTAATLPAAARLGFDGAAFLGAVWQAPDPVAAFRELSDLATRHAA